MTKQKNNIVIPKTLTSEENQSIIVKCPKCGHINEIPYCETSGKYIGTCQKCGNELSFEDDSQDLLPIEYAKILTGDSFLSIPIDPKDIAGRVYIRRDIRDINNWLLKKVKDKSIRRDLYVHLALMYWLEGKDDKVMEVARTLCGEMEIDSDTAEDIIFYFDELNKVKFKSRADEYADYRSKTYLIVETL